MTNIESLRSLQTRIREATGAGRKDCYLTYRFRLADRHSSELNRQARAVNYVWNYLNETQQKAARARRKWLSDVELQRLTAGSSAMLGLRSQTICRICRQYVRSRKQHNRPWLKFRGRRSLGWIPLHEQTIRVVGRTFRYMGKTLSPLHWREIPVGSKICEGSFAQDSRGNWHLNLVVAVPRNASVDLPAVGVDLGLKHLATLSDGRKIDIPQYFRKSESALAASQRANKSTRARNIHAKVANRRRDFLHKFSKQLTSEFGFIVVGDISPTKFAQTHLAKSVFDAGWSDLKRMLSYKSIRNGGTCLEVSERLTSQTCSSCGQLPPRRPKGIAGLGIREFTCTCGAILDRDVNAARNILRIGLDALAEGAAQMRSSQTDPDGHSICAAVIAEEETKLNQEIAL